MRQQAMNTAQPLKKWLPSKGAQAVVISAQIEEEIAQLPEERTT